MDAARTPHGDSNCYQARIKYRINDDTARTPHGDSNAFLYAILNRSVFVDAARAPHGDSNQMPDVMDDTGLGMQPAPLTGTATH